MTGAEKGARALAVWLPAGVVVLLVSLVVTLTIGPAAITPGEIMGSLWHHLTTWAHDIGIGGEPPSNPLTRIRDAIVWQGRAPRLLTAASVGAGLALSGAVMQAITRNPLADPYLLGVSSGAALGAVAVLLLGVAIALPIAAFAGALVALGATLALAGVDGRLTPGRTILAGIAVAQACSALVSFAIFSTSRGDSYREIISWLMGSLGGATWGSVAIAGLAVVIIGGVLLGSGRTLDAFVFGDVSATSLGVNVTAARWVLLTLTALLTGALVSVSGSIGFVGLVLPHVVRMLVGSRHLGLLPLAAVGGAIFLIWADTGARTVFDPMEVPVGILTAAIGAPVFAWLLLRNRSAA
ncbi:MAG: iron chelate uptake ABC transporter family permease subunit [Actinomycetales bacterium]|nr:iron chelate uptake ABC transporter family permease subunit [Actinomycetales bacterium]